MLRHPLTLVALAILLAMPSLALAQADDTPAVRALMQSIQEALVKGDFDALGASLSDEGFVAVLDLGEEAKCCSKTQFVDLLRTLVPPGGAGLDVKLEEPKIDIRWTIALVTAKLPLPDPGAQAAIVDAVAVRDAGKWKLSALMVTVPSGQPDEESIRAFVDRVAALPNALKNGDLRPLENALDEDHFVLCFVDPSGQPRWANSRAALLQLAQMIPGMVTINDSRLDVSRAVLGKSSALVDGNWFLDIADFGQTNSVLRAYAIKVNGEWRIVALGGGPAG
jgi:hypothetical protein